MERVEIELLIDQTALEVEEILLKHGFTVWHKVRTIANYYNNGEYTSKDFKAKSVRIRTAMSIMGDNRYKGRGFSANNLDLVDSKKFERDCKLSFHDAKKAEKYLSKNGFKHIITDDKTDFVYCAPDFETSKISFQIQDIKGVGTIVAYDNANYENLPYDEQRKRLIADVEKYGIKIKSTEQVDRFEPLLTGNGEKLTVKEIIKEKERLMDEIEKQK